MRYRATLPMPELRRLKQDQVNARRAELLAEGYEFEGATFATDPQSIANMTAVLAAIGAGVPLPEGFAWRDYANVNVPMDVETFKRFAGGLIGQVNRIYTQSWSKKDEIETSGTPASIDVDLKI
ncbi:MULTISPECIES: DUF4376 domain-containing protein [Methylococcus]|uniref:DUF4376 domain-containing protein n=1 Tax=Methylococcus capsulatus TaxID=414 RepID=A0ABZ2F383_METCP|nr:DUF4376 domain-containing protein [Methylococcus sp. BF19-07]